jgi:histidinol-phosphatase (PHP family)
MLTDYHVHLRPDEPGTEPEDYFTHENVERYLAAAREAGVEELGVSEHVHRFRQSLDVWDHPFWLESARDDLAAYAAFVRETPMRLGIEMDYVAGREDRIANLLDSYEFDYVIGSVHYVRDKAVDHDVWDIWESVRDPDRVWELYFATLAEAARSGLYDVLAHPDLVKVWGPERPRPQRDPRFHYEPAIEAIAESGIAVEVSTAGLRKPVRELYPASEFAEMCVDAGAAFSLSSDAHVPEHIGFAYDRAVEAMNEWGIHEVAVFEERSRRLEPLGQPDAEGVR